MVSAQAHQYVLVVFVVPYLCLSYPDTLPSESCKAEWDEQVTFSAYESIGIKRKLI